MVPQKHPKTAKTTAISQKQLMAQTKAMFADANPTSKTTNSAISDSANPAVIKTASPKTYIIITIVTFVIAIFVRLFSFGWGTLHVASDSRL